MKSGRIEAERIVPVEPTKVSHGKKHNVRDSRLDFVIRRNGLLPSAKAPSLAPMRSILLSEADWRRCGEWGPRGRDCEESHPPAGSLRSTIQLLMSQMEAF